MAKKKKNLTAAEKVKRSRGKVGGTNNPANVARVEAKTTKKAKQEKAAKIEATVAPRRLKSPASPVEPIKSKQLRDVEFSVPEESPTTPPGAPKEPAPNDEAYRQETMKAAKEKDIAEVGSEAAGAKYKAHMEELPNAVQPVKNTQKLSSDPLTPKLTPEPLPSPGQEALEAAKKAPTARKGKVAPVTFSHPIRPVPGAKVDVTQEPRIAENLTERMKSGMGLPGSENGVLDHALQLAQRDARIATQTRKVVNGIEPDSNPTSHAHVVGKHHHRLAKVMNSMNLSEEQLSSLAGKAGMRLETALTGGIPVPGSKVKSRGLHEMVQEHEDSKRTITQTTGEGDLMEHPDGSVKPVAAGMQLTRTKGKVTKVNRNMHTGEIEVSNPTHVGWDKFKAQGGKTIWRNYKEPSGTDLIDHLRKEAILAHNEEGSSRPTAADNASKITAELTGTTPRGMRRVGTRSRGKTQKVFITPAGGAPEKTTVSVKEPLLVPKPAKGEGGLNRGKTDSSGNLVPQPVKARTGKVQVRQTGVKLPKDVLAKDAQEKRATRLKGIFGTRPDEGVTEGPVKLPTVPAKQRRINQAQRKVDLAKPLPKNIPTPPGISRQMTLPGMGKVGGVDDKISGESTPIFQKVEGPLEAWQARGAEARSPVTNQPFLPSTLQVKTGEKKVPGSSKPSGRSDSRALRLQAQGQETLPESGVAQLKYIKDNGGLAAPKMSESKELEVRPGGKGKARRDRAAGAAAAKKAAAPKKAPVQLQLFSGRQFTGGTVQKVSEATQKLQGSASAPRGSKPNPYEKEADTLLERTQNKSK